MTRDLQIQFNSKNASTRVVGTTANYLEVRKYELDGGRMFTTQEDAGKQRLVVVGPGVLTNLGVENMDAIIGESVRIRGIQFTVIGVLKSKGQASAFGNPDDQVLIPIQTARFRIFGTDRVNSISVLAQSETLIPEAMADVQKILRREHRLPREKDDDFNIRNQADFLTTAAETTQGVQLTAGGHRVSVADRRRDRHHEHHAGLGHRAHPRDRRAQGARRDEQEHPVPVPHRGGRALPVGWRDRRR